MVFSAIIASVCSSLVSLESTRSGNPSNCVTVGNPSMQRISDAATDASHASFWIGAVAHRIFSLLRSSSLNLSSPMLCELLVPLLSRSEVRSSSSGDKCFAKMERTPNDDTVVFSPLRFAILCLGSSLPTLNESESRRFRSNVS